MPTDYYIPDLSTEKLTSISPYFLLVNNNLTIEKCGQYWQKHWSILPGASLTSQLFILAPHFSQINFDQLICQQHQLFILSSTDKKLCWKGHIEYIEKTRQLLFTGNPVLQPALALSIPWKKDIDLKHEKNETLLNFDNDNIQLAGLNEFSSKREAINSLALIAEEINNGVIITNKRGEIIWVNKGFERITEFELHEIKGKKPGSFLTGPETNLQTIAYLRNQIQYKSSFNCEILNYTKSGNRYWVKISGHPIFDEKGELSRFFSIQEVITEKKEAENHLQDQKLFYERILNEIPADIAVFDEEHRYLFVNPKGIKNEELRKWIIGKKDEDYLAYRNKPLSIAEDRRKLFNRVVQNKKIFSWEETLTNAHGSKEYHLRTMMPVLDEDEHVKMVIGYGLDITNRRKVEEKLILNEKRYRDLFNFSQALICTHDAKGKFLSVNPAICETLGFASQEMIGRPIIEFLPPDNIDSFNELYLEKVINEGKEKRGIHCIE